MWPVNEKEKRWRGNLKVKTCKNNYFYLLTFLLVLGFELRALMLARQALYQLSHSTSPKQLLSNGRLVSTYGFCEVWKHKECLWTWGLPLISTLNWASLHVLYFIALRKHFKSYHYPSTWEADLSQKKVMYIKVPATEIRKRKSGKKK
jgi:hypothetical protein